MNKESLGDKLSGKGREEIPNIAFHIMTAIMRLMDVFGKHADKNFSRLDLRAGQTVIDYGCGPARYIESASRAVGKSGKVIAVDIHPLAIKKVKEKIEKHELGNVEAVLADGYNTSIPSEAADVVYALDMFHMIKEPKAFLSELSRLVKSDGTVIIEDGHQSRSETVQKIGESEVLEIIQQAKSHVRCKKSAPCN